MRSLSSHNRRCGMPRRFASKNRTCGTRFRGSPSKQKEVSDATCRARARTFVARPSQTRDLRTQQGDRTPNMEHAPQRRWTGVTAPVQQCRTDPQACPDHRDVVDVTNGTTHSNRVYSFLRRLKTSLSAHEQRAFAASDANARRYGCQITRAQGGLSANYRDAGFGYLNTCATGGGGGCNSCGAQRSEHSLKEPTS